MDELDPPGPPKKNSTTVTVSTAVHARLTAARTRMRHIGDRLPAIVRARLDEAALDATGRERGRQGLTVVIDIAMDALEAMLERVDELRRKEPTP